jgi:hypothetical protein
MKYNDEEIDNSISLEEFDFDDVQNQRSNLFQNNA